MFKQVAWVALSTSLLAVSGCAEGQSGANPDATTVATVNGKAVSTDVWNLWLQTRTRGATEELTAEGKDELLDELIQMYLAAEDAEKQALAQGEDLARMELMRMSAFADVASRSFLDGEEPTEEELKAEYDKQVAALPKLEYNAKHILVDSEVKARELITRLDAGERFETLAEQNSSDSSAQNGGDLGWFAAARMVKPFADAVESMEKGKYSTEPVQSQFGWHVIKLEDTRDLAPPGYGDVKEQLAPLVKQGRFQTYLDELQQKAKVEKKLD